jgi:hypothetical protein
MQFCPLFLTKDIRKHAMLWRGIVVIESASRTEDPGFKYTEYPPQGLRDIHCTAVVKNVLSLVVLEKIKRLNKISERFLAETD